MHRVTCFLCVHITVINLTVTGWEMKFQNTFVANAPLECIGTTNAEGRVGGSSAWWPCVLPIWFVILVTAGVGRADAQAKADEYRVKAAFLSHFAQLVDWPAEAFGANGNPLTLCTIGDDPFHGMLDSTVEGKSVASHPLRARHATQPAELMGCHIVFLAGNEAKHTPALLASLQGTSALTVGESDEFL